LIRYFVAQRHNSDPKNTTAMTVPDPPMSYKLYYWRRAMGMSYEQMEITPADIIFQDLEYINLEKQYKPKEGTA